MCVLVDYDYGDTTVNAGANAADKWDPNPGAAVDIEYDETGNMTVWGSDILEWDADNRLRAYDKGSGTDTGYVYDADGDRVLRIHGATVTTYIGDMFETDGTTTTLYYLFAGDTVGYHQTTTSSDVRYYLSSDHLGSTATIVESTDLAHPVDQYYYPYGQPRTGWAINTDRAYTGQTTDQDETGLYDYNARYYHPALHRFISADTIIPNPANPQTANRYSYVTNNPLTYVDPSGHFLERNISYGSGGGGDPDPSDGTIGGTGGSTGGGLSGGQLGEWITTAAKWTIFDPDPCLTGHYLSCTIEVASILPIFGKLLKLFKHSDEVADIYKYGTSHIDEATDTADDVIRHPGPGTPHVDDMFDGLRGRARPDFADSTVSPGPDWQWRGSGPVGSSQGNWYNPKTAESLHADLSHGGSIGPHYDYRAPDGTWYRWFADGTMEAK